MYNMYDAIYALCQEKGTSIPKLCKDLGMSRSTFAELKSGRTKKLSTSTLEKIANHFRVPIDFLVESGEPSPSDIPPEGPITDSQLLFALYGEVPEEIDDADIADIKRYADMVRLRKIQERRRNESE